MSFIKKTLNIIEKVEKKSDHLPQHPMLQWSAPSPEQKRDHLEDYKEVQPFEESEGFLDMFSSVASLRKTYKKLCEKLKMKVPENIEEMTKKEITAAIKSLKEKLKGKLPTSGDIWKGLGDLSTLFA